MFLALLSPLQGLDERSNLHTGRCPVLLLMPLWGKVKFYYKGICNKERQERTGYAQKINSQIFR